MDDSKDAGPTKLDLNIEDLTAVVVDAAFFTCIGLWDRVCWK